MIYKKNGVVLDGQFEIDGVKYPPNWLELSTNEEKLALGITSEAEPESAPEVVPVTNEEQPALNEKYNSLDSIVVTTSLGKTFNGNALARNNMLSAIISSEFLGQTTTNWKLVDNSVVSVNVDEIKEALALSIQQVGQIVTA